MSGSRRTLASAPAPLSGPLRWAQPWVVSSLGGGGRALSPQRAPWDGWGRRTKPPKEPVCPAARPAAVLTCAQERDRPRGCHRALPPVPPHLVWVMGAGGYLGPVSRSFLIHHDWRSQDLPRLDGPLGVSTVGSGSLHPRRQDPVFTAHFRSRDALQVQTSCDLYTLSS